MIVALERVGPEGDNLDAVAKPLLEAWKAAMVEYPEADAQAIGHSLLSVINVALEKDATWNQLAFGFAFAMGQLIACMDPTPGPEQASAHLNDIKRRAMSIVADLVRTMAAETDRKLDS